MKLRIATRQSPLALYQAQFVAKLLLLQQSDLEIELVKITSSGDKFITESLAKIGGKGLFTKELEQALLDNTADIAVHSIKDMPVDIPKNLSLGAICKRANPTDSLVSKQFVDLDALPAGAIVGTSSLRRQSQLLSTRPDLKITAIRGNIHTRLSKLSDSFAAIVMASAALERLNIHDYHCYQLPLDKFIPAVGQGAIGVEYNSNNQHIAKLLANINHFKTGVCVQAERAMNKVLGGNCHTPIGAYASIEKNKIILNASVLSSNGKRIISATASGDLTQSTQIGQQVAHILLDKGARQLLN